MQHQVNPNGNYELRSDNDMSSRSTDCKCTTWMLKVGEAVLSTQFHCESETVLFG